MTLKEKFLSINNIDEVTDEEFCKLINSLGMKDEEIAKHYNYLQEKSNYKDKIKHLKEEEESGFEILELLRKQNK